MLGLEIIALWLGVSFFFVILGYASKNKVFTFVGGSALLILSIMLLVFGYDIQTGTNLITSNITNGTNQTATNTYTNTKDTYSYAFGTILLIVSFYLILQLLRGML